MKKPIFRVQIQYSIRKNKSTRAKIIKGDIDTFALTDVISDIKSDKDMLLKIYRDSKKDPINHTVTMDKINIIKQHGYTTDRF
ncbi:hypothetical protein H8D85_02210 [bacterium]|nr:hypothetical protein [bacterium]